MSERKDADDPLIQQAREVTESELAPPSTKPDKTEQHVEVIRLYSRWLLWALIAWMTAAAATFWAAMYFRWHFSFPQTFYWVTPIVALTLLLGAIAHHAFRNPADSKERSSPASETYRLLEKIIHSLSK